MKKTIVVFSNCHGEKYIDIFRRDTNIEKHFNIEYIVSYDYLYKFNEVKYYFMKADILIINNIKQYEDYKIQNLKKYLKDDVLIIIAPFVRFNGYWLPERYKPLKYVKDNTVSFFPDIQEEEINNYLNLEINKEIFLKYYNECLKKLKLIEDESHIKFYEFFIKNHLQYPFFRDYQHPTQNMIEYITKQIIYKIK